MIEQKEIVCVVCPSSCRITVEGDGQNITNIQGFTCKRGEEYAKTEYLAPKRTIATTIKAKDYVAPVISVRTDKPVPKEMVFECMEVIRKAEAYPPFEVGKVVIENILNTGVNIILTNV